MLSKLEMQEQLFKKAQEEKEHFLQRILDLEAMVPETLKHGHCCIYLEDLCLVYNSGS